MNGRTSFTTIVSLGALFLLMVFVTGCASPRTYVTEERKFIQLHHVANTGADLNLKKGDAIAMACAKCRTVLKRSRSPTLSLKPPMLVLAVTVWYPSAPWTAFFGYEQSTRRPPPRYD